jgi:hypothetical protein
VGLGSTGAKDGSIGAISGKYDKGVGGISSDGNNGGNGYNKFPVNIWIFYLINSRCLSLTCGGVYNEGCGASVRERVVLRARGILFSLGKCCLESGKLILWY